MRRDPSWLGLGEVGDPFAAPFSQILSIYATSVRMCLALPLRGLTIRC